MHGESVLTTGKDTICRESGGRWIYDGREATGLLKYRATWRLQLNDLWRGKGLVINRLHGSTQCEQARGGQVESNTEIGVTRTRVGRKKSAMRSPRSRYGGRIDCGILAGGTIRQVNLSVENSEIGCRYGGIG